MEGGRRGEEEGERLAYPAKDMHNLKLTPRFLFLTTPTEEQPDDASRVY